MKISNHRLQGDLPYGLAGEIKFVKSPNFSGNLDPDTVVIHYTAGRDAESAVKTLCDPNVKASAHLVIGREGEVYQLVPFNVIAWHAGQSSYGGRTGYNKYSVGIEIDNAGVLTRSDHQYVSWFGRVYEAKDVVQAVHRNETTPRYWHRYTEVQILLVEEICRLLVAQYGIRDILGHEEIAPHRKIDPGPAFPLDKMRQRILHPNRDQDAGEEFEFPASGIVSAERLNIRAAAGGFGEKIARPLPRNTRVKILEEKNGWYRVKTEIEGWVSADYIQLEK
ncbi:MAG: hypothetical protein Kow0042_22190 [Calditrichia bacterium]